MSGARAEPFRISDFVMHSDAENDKRLDKHLWLMFDCMLMHDWFLEIIFLLKYLGLDGGSYVGL